MKRKCNDCGCNRKILIKSNVFIHQKLEMHLKVLCVPCLLKTLKLTQHWDKDKYDYIKAMEVID